MNSGLQRSPDDERGQALMMWLLAFTAIIGIGAIAIDFGLWLSERYGAQNDSDFSVLAGAQPYLDNLTDTGTAFDDAVQWAVQNGVDPAKIDGVPTSDCSPGNSCIDVGTSGCREPGDNMPWVEARVRHPSRALFASLFGLVAPDIGAVARACVGSPITRYDLSPFGVQTNFSPAVGNSETGAQCGDLDDDDGDGEDDDGCPLSGCLEPNPSIPGQTRPVYGAVCILKTSGQGGVSGQRGQLTIGSTDCGQTSANNLRHDFHYGAGAPCTIGYEVNTGTGTINGLLQGLEDRLGEEGRCDSLFGTGHTSWDDFDEVFSLAGADPGEPIVPSAANVFSENPCHATTGQNGVPMDQYNASHTHSYLPRAVHLLLIDELVQSDQTATITGFAGFYIIGCFRDDDSAQIKQQIEQDLTNLDPYLNRCPRPTGQDDILGIFVQTLAPPEGVGDPHANLPLSIVLVK